MCECVCYSKLYHCYFQSLFFIVFIPRTIGANCRRCFMFFYFFVVISFCFRCTAFAFGSSRKLSELSLGEMISSVVDTIREILIENRIRQSKHDQRSSKMDFLLDLVRWEPLYWPKRCCMWFCLIDSSATMR